MTYYDTSSVRAENDPKFYTRWKWVGIGMLLFMLYSLYDGFIAFPKELECYETLISLKDQLIEEGLTESELNERFATEWEIIATENNWPVDTTKIKDRTLADIYTNYAFAVLGGIVGPWMLFTVWRSNGRWIEVNSEGLDSSSGDSVTFEQATFLEKKQWADKGIAWLHFKRNGVKGRFLIDNFKYMREETNEILRRVEKAIGVDKIKGGPPESDNMMQQNKGTTDS